MSTHPAEANDKLASAWEILCKLIREAETRGDQAGADAWLVARKAVESAEKAMSFARTQQTWRRT